MKTFELFVLAVFILACGCSENREADLADELHGEPLTFEDYAYAGVVHNQYLQFVVDNQNNLDTTIEDGGLALDHLVGFLSQNRLESDIFDTELMEAEMNKFIDEHKGFFDQNSLLERAESPGLLMEINEAKTDGYLDDFEYELFNWGINAYVDGIKPEEFKTSISAWVDGWHSQNYTRNGTNGRISAVALNVALYSIEFWENNESYIYSHTDLGRAIPFVAIGAADLVGGFGSALFAHFTDALDTEDCQCDADCACCYTNAFIGGAIAGSTGYAGKVGRWISRLF